MHLGLCNPRRNRVAPITIVIIAKMGIKIQTVHLSRMSKATIRNFLIVYIEVSQWVKRDILHLVFYSGVFKAGSTKSSNNIPLGEP